MKFPVQPASELDKFVLRLPAGMREKIADEAKASGRSMNAEMVYRLERSFDLESTGGDGIDRLVELQRPVAVLEGWLQDLKANPAPEGRSIPNREKFVQTIEAQLAEARKAVELEREKLLARLQKSRPRVGSKSR